MIVSLTILNRYAENYGTLAIATFGIAIKLNMLPKFITMGFARGIQPFIGYNYGMKNRERMNSFIRSGYLWCNIICLSLASIMLFLSRPILGYFLPEGSAIEAGLPIIRITLFAIIFVGFMQIKIASVQAQRKKVTAFYLFLAHGGFFILLLFLTSFFDSPLVLALSFPLSDGLTALLAVILTKARVH